MKWYARCSIRLDVDGGTLKLEKVAELSAAAVRRLCIQISTTHDVDI